MKNTKDAEKINKELKPWLPKKWDYEADVVVVGYGGSGQVTAATATEAGAKVIILEKAPIEGGGTTRMSGAHVAYCKPENVADAAKYLYVACDGSTPMDVCQAWAEGIAGIPAWLTEMGVKFELMTGGEKLLGGPEFKNFPGATALNGLHILGSGSQFFNWANKYMKAKGIPILFNTPAKKLIQDYITKEILGVYAEKDGETIAVKAKQGVVLCTGGFEYNEEMKGNYLRPTPLKSSSWKYNTGDGIKMAQAVGADLWHMNVAVCAGETFMTPLSEIGYYKPFAKAGSHIWVNRYGKRFACENPAGSTHKRFMYFDHWDWSNNQKDARYPCCPFYLIFDEKTRLAGPLCYDASYVVEQEKNRNRGPDAIPLRLGGSAEYWSDDNSREIKLGWIKKGNTIRELAQVMGGDIDPKVLEETVARYNGFCAAGKDLGFGRPAKAKFGMKPEIFPNLIALDTPPFYGIELYPSIYNTCGGPKKNGKAQVLDTDGKPIPRLYEAGVLGETCGHVYSMIGQNWAEILSFGRIAGENVTTDTSWE